MGIQIDIKKIKNNIDNLLTRFQNAIKRIVERQSFEYACKIFCTKVEEQ